MWVKICANTNVEDALLAVQAGADAVGFVFAPGPRQVTAEQAGKITSQLGDAVETIGVFDRLELAYILDCVRTACLTGVQLHGGYSPDLVAALRNELSPAHRIIQTRHWSVGRQVPEAFGAELRQLRSAAGVDAVLVDSRTAVASGGTGTAFDWRAARDGLAELGTMPLIVAGGLTPDNVGTAIQVLRPWGVDVASGVEASPGRKDPAKVRAFIRAAQRARLAVAPS